VPRPRLIQRLDEGLRLGHRLTLICAPAGFGKTTLLSEWVGRCGRPVAWLSLDESDNDPARFLAYFVAALQTIEARQASVASIGEGVFQAPQSPSMESVLTALINEIASIPDPFVLVLDDYHLIKAQPIQSALTFLLAHMPPQMHLVIATRADPPLPMARLRGRGQLTELRLTDLRFTSDEVAEFLNQVMDLEPTPDDIAALASHTEGWIAGLQMATLAMQARVSMQSEGDISGFVQAFAGSDRYILDYLVEEVLQRQRDSVQAFLLQTAILDRLTAPLCDAVTGRDDGQATLEGMERTNLFIVPLDNERRWYRYHRLFADLLRKRLHQGYPDLVPTLHRQASEWYEQSGLMAAAVDHALSARDFERAAHLIEQMAQATLMRSEVATLLSWVDALPEELVRAHPHLCVFHAWALFLAGRPLHIVESRLQDVDQATDLMPSKMAPLHAFVATLQGRLPRAAELSRQALAELPENDLFLRSIATWNLGISHLASGDLAAGIRVFEETVRMGQEMGNVMTVVMALCHLAELRVRHAQLHEARAIYQRALELATDQRGQLLPIAGEVLMGLGELLREWNDLQAATGYLKEGIELTRHWSEFGALDGYVTLAGVRQAQGDADGARDAIQTAQHIAMRFDATEMDDLAVAMYYARLSVAQGDIEAAMRWVEERGLEDSGASVELEDTEAFVNSHLRKYEHLVLARLRIAQDRPGEALTLLAPLLPRMEQQGRTQMVIEIHLLRALAFQAQGDMAQAMTALEHALLLAEPAGYMRIFLDEGGPMGELLRQAATRGMGGGLRESIARGFWCAGGHIGVWQDGGSTSASLC